MNGDPHLTTFDGNQYTFNGLGEYLLIDAPHTATNSTIVLQGRTALVPNSTATVFSALAMGYYSGTSGQHIGLDNLVFQSGLVLLRAAKL